MSFLWVFCRVGSFSYTPRARICLTLKRMRSFSHTPCVRICLAVRRVGILSYMPRASMSCFRFVRASATDRVMESVVSFDGKGICQRCLMLESVSSFESGKFILQVPCWKVSGRSSGVGDGGWDSVLGSVIEPVSSVVVWGDSFKPYPGIYFISRRLDSFSYSSRTGICLVVRQVGTFSYTPRPGFCLVVGRVGSFSYTPRAGTCVVSRHGGGGGKGRVAPYM